MAPQLVESINASIEKAVTPILGSAIWWELSGLEIPVADLESRAAYAGIDPNLVPKPETRGALKRALESLGFGEQAPGVTRRYGLTYSEGDIVATIYDETVSRDQVGFAQAAYTPVQVVRYDRASRSLEFTGSYCELEIRDAFQKAQGVVKTAGISTLIRRVLDGGHAIRLKKRGGLYFLPLEYVPIAESVRKLLDGLAGVDVVTLPLADIEAARKDVLNAAEREIRESLEALELDLQAVKSSERKTQAGTLHERLERYAALKERILTYSELVGYSAVNVMTKTAEMEEEIKRIIDAKKGA